MGEWGAKATTKKEMIVSGKVKKKENERSKKDGRSQLLWFKIYFDAYLWLQL